MTTAVPIQRLPVLTISIDSVKSRKTGDSGKETTDRYLHDCKTSFWESAFLVCFYGRGASSIVSAFSRNS